MPIGEDAKEQLDSLTVLELILVSFAQKRQLGGLNFSKGTYFHYSITRLSQSVFLQQMHSQHQKRPLG